jgi:glycosyltransferase involved in cell wall biosynthesis
MAFPAHRPPAGRRHYHRPPGIYWDDFHTESAWLRDQGRLHLPAMDLGAVLVLKGECLLHPEALASERTLPTLTVTAEGGGSATLRPEATGAWELRVSVAAGRGTTLRLALGGVVLSNFLAWMGRITGIGALQRFRAQRKNRQLRLRTLETAGGEVVFDFSRRDAPFSADLHRKHFKPAINIVGFLSADLGIGESARCMVRAADAAGIETALVPLRLACRNRDGDPTYAARLAQDNPHPVNVIHVDPPATRDLVHHHGRAFFRGRRNVGFFAWELTDFPDAWTPYLDFYDEIWCPSEFTRKAIEPKSPVPVLHFPHAISFQRLEEDVPSLRRRLGLPGEGFLFLSIFDLNSYAARKNPAAAIEAFRRSGLRPPEAGLVVKLQNAALNPGDHAALQATVSGLQGVTLIEETLSRADTYALEAACDCLVSLHRSEGFGLAVAECMYLGRPVIATDWSATAEYLDASNGCPVGYRLVTLDRNHGPYARGATWAEADIDDAAASMQRLARDSSLASRLGAAGRRTIEGRFSPSVVGAMYRRRLENLG